MYQYNLKTLNQEFNHIKTLLPISYGGYGSDTLLENTIRHYQFSNIDFNNNYNITNIISSDSYSNIEEIKLLSDNNINFIINNFDNTFKYYLNYIKITNNSSSNITINNISINNNSNNNFSQIIDTNNSYNFNNSDFNNLQFFTSNININTSIDEQNFNIEVYLIVEKPTLYLNNYLKFINKYNTNNDSLNKIILKNDGSIGIGTEDTKNYSLYVNNIGNFKKGIYCADDITLLSDINFKTDINTIENPIDKLIKLRGVTYKRIDRDFDNKRYGFIAQEVQKILPEACDNSMGIKQIDIVALIVETIKELIKKNNLKI
jgi:hypothetical protein